MITGVIIIIVIVIVVIVVVVVTVKGIICNVSTKGGQSTTGLCQGLYNGMTHHTIGTLVVDVVIVVIVDYVIAVVGVEGGMSARGGGSAGCGVIAIVKLTEDDAILQWFAGGD